MGDCQEIRLYTKDPSKKDNIIIEKTKEIYPNFVKLLIIINTLPVNTADVEGAFSARTLIKTKYRCKLDSKHLDELLRIKALCKEFDKEYIIREAYEIWNR